MDGRIHQITGNSGCTEADVFITGSNNFRKTEATILPYKGNRKDKERPVHYRRIKDYLLSTKNHEVILCEDYEADDGMAMAQMAEFPHPHTPLYASTVICSRDKDLKMVPGLHYSWASGKQKELAQFITVDEGLKWFFTQLLMGDPTDNIPGLYMVGKVKAAKLLYGLSGALSWYTVCQAQYELRFGSYWKMFMHENARLLWMMQSETDDVRDWLSVLEIERLDNKIWEKEY